MTGGIPPELGNLSNLAWLLVNDTQLSGPLPLTLANLHVLQQFSFQNTDLCEPGDPAFQSWLASIPQLLRTGVICGTQPTPTRTPTLTGSPNPTATPTPIETSAVGQITIAQGQEPDTLYVYGGSMLVNAEIMQMVMEGPVTHLGGVYQPVILTKIPRLRGRRCRHRDGDGDQRHAYLRARRNGHHLQRRAHHHAAYGGHLHHAQRRALVGRRCS